MKRAVTLLLLSTSSALAVSAADAPTADVVLDRMRRAQAAVRTLTADLQQVKSYPQLGIDDPPERGTFTLKREGASTMVRMDIHEPESRVLVVADGNYLLYQPRIRQAVEGRLSAGGKQGVFSGVLTGSPDALAQLDSDYRVATRGEEMLSGGNVVRLEFEAQPNAAVYCATIDLWVDTVTWLPVQQSCHEANQSVITFTLEGVALNAPLAKGTFDVELPPDVEKVRG